MDFSKLYIDCRNLIEDLIPHFKRKEVFVNFMSIVADECQVTANDLYEIAWKTKELLKYNGQIGVYQEFLNDYWDNTQRRIYIETNNVYGRLTTLYLGEEYDPSPDTLYLQREGKSGWVSYLQSEITGLSFYNFTIYVPAALWASWTTSQQNTFRANAAIYALAGNDFNIDTF